MKRVDDRLYMMVSETEMDHGYIDLSLTDLRLLAVVGIGLERVVWRTVAPA